VEEAFAERAHCQKKKTIAHFLKEALETAEAWLQYLDISKSPSTSHMAVTPRQVSAGAATEQMTTERPFFLRLSDRDVTFPR
jgi:hypothetical protein